MRTPESRAGHLLACLGLRVPCRDLTVAVVVAHPDDETVAAGAALPLLPGVRVVHVTDGAPRDGADARRRGFPSAEAYAAARREELERALALTGVPHAIVGPFTADQEAALDLAGLARTLADVLLGVDVVLTHAWEGGHPDHDAVAFAVHAAAGLLEVHAPEIVEVPLYRAGPGGWVRQAFVEGDAGALVVQLSPAEQRLKERMIACYATQADVLAGFSTAVERYRVARPLDPAELPNGGDLLYERYGWGMTGERFRALARDAFVELMECACA